MKTYVVLFRGINVVGKHIVPMAELKNLLAELGYADVRTYIQSGNVVLRGARRPGADIADAVGSRFGFTPAVLALTKAEFAAAVRGNPFPDAEGRAVHVYFCTGKPRTDLRKLEERAAPSERYELRGRAFYLFAPEGIGRSKLAAGIDSCLGVPTTARNLNTVRTLQRMLAET